MTTGDGLAIGLSVMGLCLPIAATILHFGLKSVARVVSEVRADYGVLSTHVAGIQEAVGTLKQNMNEVLTESRRWRAGTQS